VHITGPPRRATIDEAGTGGRPDGREGTGDRDRGRGGGTGDHGRQVRPVPVGQRRRCLKAGDRALQIRRAFDGIRRRARGRVPAHPGSARLVGGRQRGGRRWDRGRRGGAPRAVRVTPYRGALDMVGTSEKDTRGRGRQGTGTEVVQPVAERIGRHGPPVL